VPHGRQVGHIVVEVPEELQEGHRVLPQPGALLLRLPRLRERERKGGEKKQSSMDSADVSNKQVFFPKSPHQVEHAAQHGQQQEGRLHVHAVDRAHHGATGGRDAEDESPDGVQVELRGRTEVNTPQVNTRHVVIR